MSVALIVAAVILALFSVDARRQWRAYKRVIFDPQRRKGDRVKGPARGPRSDGPGASRKRDKGRGR